MLGDRTPLSLENSEESRAFLQARVALFWKVVRWIMAFASVLGAVGAFKHPGADLILDLLLAAQAGALWWLCQRGERSARFSRAVEAVGGLSFFCGSAYPSSPACRG